MHALVKKNKNAERYSQNSCQDIQKEFQHFVDPRPLRDADSQVTRCTRKRLKGCSLKLRNLTYNPGKKKKKKEKTREINTQITYIIIFR
jgi:hypothetical protein